MSLPNTVSQVYQLIKDRGWRLCKDQCYIDEHHELKIVCTWCQNYNDQHPWIDEEWVYTFQTQPWKILEGYRCPSCVERSSWVRGQHYTDIVKSRGGMPVGPNRVQCQNRHTFNLSLRQLEQGDWCPQCRSTPKNRSTNCDISENPKSFDTPTPQMSATSTMLPAISPEILDRYRPKKDVSVHLNIVDAPPHVKIDLLVLTVKEPEFLAVFELLEPLPSETQILGYLFEHSMYYFGRYGNYNAVLLASHTAGLEPALHSLGDSIRQWRPQLVINVGIAWGADPSTQKFGDVLIAERVVNVDDVRHEMFEIVESGPMPEIEARSRAIVHTCKLLWNFNNLEDQKSGVHIGLYLGSNTLLNNPDRKKEFLQRHPRAIGGEMESFAVYAAAARSKIPWIVVKGISDWGDGTKPPNKAYHGIATASAASFAHKICTAFPNLLQTTRDQLDEKKVDSVSSRTDISATAFSGVAHTVSSSVAIGSLHGNLYLNTGSSQHLDQNHEMMTGRPSLRNELKIWLGNVIIKTPAFQVNKFGQFNLKINERSLNSTLFAQGEQASLSIEPTNLIIYRLPVRVEGDLYKLEIAGFRIPKFQHCGRVISEEAIVQVKLQLDASSSSLQLVSVSIEDVNELFSGIGAESQLGKVRALSRDIRSALDEKFVLETLKLILSGNVAQSPEDKKKLEPRNTNLIQVVSHFKPKRLGELQQRITLLKEGSPGLIVCAITGIAGCGKSELAKAYGWGFPAAPHIFRWRLDSEPSSDSSAASYKQSYIELLDNFRIRNRNDRTSNQIDKSSRNKLWRRISHYSEWVVIFDNASSYNDIEQYLPEESTLNGGILVTTRNSNFLAQPELNFSVNRGLDPQEATQLLQKLSSQIDPSGAMVLVGKFDYLPLSIRIAAVYIKNHNANVPSDAQLTFPKYALLIEDAHDLLEEIRPELVSQATNHQFKSSLRCVLRLSINKIRDTNADLLALLQNCAFVNNEKIPYKLLLYLCKFRADEQQIVTELRFNKFITETHSLLTYDKSTQAYYMHRTTQIELTSSLNESPIQIIKRLSDALALLYPYDKYSIDQTSACRGVYHHMVALVDRARIYPELSKQRRSLLLTLGRVHRSFGEYNDSLKCISEALELIQHDDDQDMLISLLLERGEIKKFLGDYKGNAKDFEDALHRCASQNRKDDIRIGYIYNEIAANLYRDQDSSSPDILRSSSLDILDLYYKALKICSTVEPLSRQASLIMAESYNGIALCLKRIDDFVGALDNYKKSLAIYQDHLDKAHPFVGVVYSNIGGLGWNGATERFADRGIDYQTCLENLQKALDIKSGAYGENTYECANSYGWISIMLYAGGELKSALENRDKEIGIWKTIDDENHPELIMSYYWKGRILEKYADQEKIGLAILAYEKALNLSKRHPGKMVNWVHKINNRLQEIRHSKESNT